MYQKKIVTSMCQFQLIWAPKGDFENKSYLLVTEVKVSSRRGFNHKNTCRCMIKTYFLEKKLMALQKERKDKFNPCTKVYSSA